MLVIAQPPCVNMHSNDLVHIVGIILQTELLGNSLQHVTDIIQPCRAWFTQHMKNMILT